MREERERKNRIKSKMEKMFRKGPARLHAFGSGDFEEFKVSDLSSKDQEKIKGDVSKKAHRLR